MWDVPAEGIIAAARAAGRANDLQIVTEDLGLNVAIGMAQRGAVKALGAQRPFDQGVTEARLAAYGLLGKKAPPYVAWPALAVTHATSCRPGARSTTSRRRASCARPRR